MRKGLAILFSLALVLSQPLSGSVVVQSPCCPCGGTKCCVDKSDKTTKETPVVPAASSGQKDFQTIAWLSVRTLTLPQISANQTTPSVAVVPFATAVALFTRDCAYLL
jgi:hypothetical protein